MTSTTPCWRCLTQSRHGRRTPTSFTPLQRLTSIPPISPAFSTSAALSNPAVNAKRPGGITLGPPKRGEQKTFRLQKKKGGHDKGRPPGPGERKAGRKRIVLSNINAIEVHGMQDLSAKTMIDMRLRGQMLGIPGPVIDQLRAVEAFKVSQGWGLFRRPSMLMRKETLEYGKLFDLMDSSPTDPSQRDQNIRRILVGEKGSGKSMLLLQVLSMAFLKNWIVINIPDGSCPSSLPLKCCLQLTIAFDSHGPHKRPHIILPLAWEQSNPIHPKDLPYNSPFLDRPLEQLCTLKPNTLPHAHSSRQHAPTVESLPLPSRLTRSFRPRPRVARVSSPLA